MAEDEKEGRESVGVLLLAISVLLALMPSRSIERLALMVVVLLLLLLLLSLPLVVVFTTGTWTMHATKPVHEEAASSSVGSWGGKAGESSFALCRCLT
jgi:hypothetical protein